MVQLQSHKRLMKRQVCAVTKDLQNMEYSHNRLTKHWVQSQQTNKTLSIVTTDQQNLEHSYNRLKKHRNDLKNIKYSHKMMQQTEKTE